MTTFHQKLAQIFNNIIIYNIYYKSQGEGILPVDLETMKAKNKQYEKWLEAQIALQQEMLGNTTDSRVRLFKEGKIALLRSELNKITKK